MSNEVSDRSASARRVHHYDVNVRDLEESIEFYRAATSLRPRPVVRNAAGFLLGRTDGLVESALLIGPVVSFGHPALHLMQWIVPAPVGTAHAFESSTGFYRIVVHSPDLARRRRVVRALGAEPFAPTTGDDFRFHIASRGSVPFHAFACHDPNGIVVEFVSGPVPRLSVVAQGTADVDRSARLLEDVLGLTPFDTVRTIDAVPNIYSRRGGEVRFRGVFLRAPDDLNGYVDLLQFEEPEPRPSYREAHQVGILRAVFEVGDLAAAWSRVLAASGSVVPEHPPTSFDFGPPVGVRRVAGFRDPEGVRVQLIEPGAWSSSP